MAEVIKILVVEDDDDQLQAYNDAADELSTDEFRFELVTKQSAPDAKKELLSREFDGAIVDLNLSSGDPEEVSGNEVLLEITEKHRFPVLVVSGNLQNLDESIQHSSFFKTFSRETPNEVIFNYLLNVYNTGITRILGGRGLIEQHLSDIFWRHLACDFDSWNAGGRDSERTLLRYAVAHLAEYLDLPSGEDDDGYYHEAEFYIIPPIREHIATGDIVRRDDSIYIVLSPPCDVAVRSVVEGTPGINADTIVLAPLLPVDRATFIDKGLIKEGNGNDNSGGREKLMDEIIKGKREKYVLLPGYRDIAPAVADLQNLFAWSLDDFLQAQRLATVTGAFLKDIQARFAAYYGRQGQPDLDKKELLKKYKLKLAPD